MDLHFVVSWPGGSTDQRDSNCLPFAWFTGVSSARSLWGNLQREASGNWRVKNRGVFFFLPCFAISFSMTADTVLALSSSKPHGECPNASGLCIGGAFQLTEAEESTTNNALQPSSTKHVPLSCFSWTKAVYSFVPDCHSACYSPLTLSDSTREEVSSTIRRDQH